MARVHVGSAAGLFEIDLSRPEPKATLDEGLGERTVTGLARDGGALVALLDDRSLARRREEASWHEVAVSDRFPASCLLASAHGLFVGTDEAHLLLLRDGSLVGVESFEQVEGRRTWYTPWGGPPAVRSIAEDRAGRIHVNVHVGGIPRSVDGGGTWQPTIDIHTDVHEVIAHPVLPDGVLAAAAVGLALSEDGGETWRIEDEGLHSTYARAVALAGDTIIMSASEGPRGRRAAVYRAGLPHRDGLRFERCTAGLPDWFDANIDTGCLAALGSTVAFGTERGSVFASIDEGETWTEAASGLPPVRSVLVR